MIIGGGVIGCTLAWRLAQRGLDVLVLERDEPARAATWAAAGMLTPLGEAGTTGAFLNLCADSLELWPAFAREIEQAAGIEVDLRHGGRLIAALTGPDADALEALADSDGGRRFSARLVTSAQAIELEPALNTIVRAGLLVPGDMHVDNRLLGFAAARAAAAAGVAVRSGARVDGLLTSAGDVSGVQLGSERVATPRVVVAAGAWSAGLAGLPRALPVRPVRGQMLAIRGAQLLPQRLLWSPDCYLVPRSDGRLLIGATVEDVGFEAAPSGPAIAGLRAAAAELLPATAHMEEVERWSGFRPGSPDDLPILGADAHVRGLYYATGHYRNGILLAPVTADALAELIVTETMPAQIAPFTVERFA